LPKGKILSSLRSQKAHNDRRDYVKKSLIGCLEAVGIDAVGILVFRHLYAFTCATSPTKSM
jgi:hypothetical protein